MGCIFSSHLHRGILVKVFGADNADFTLAEQLPAVLFCHVCVFSLHRRIYPNSQKIISDKDACASDMQSTVLSTEGSCDAQFDAGGTRGLGTRHDAGARDQIALISG